MNVIKDETVETRNYRRGIELEGVEPILLDRRYSHGGKEFLPDYAFARWNHGEPIIEISLRGHVLKKDGTPGKDRADITCLTPAHNLYEKYDYPSAPQWVLELFADSPHTTPEESK